MEQVFSVEMAGSFSPSALNAGRSSPASQPYKVGTVEKNLGNGKFVVLMEDGQKIEVRGSAVVKAGQKVQVFSPKASSKGLLPANSLAPDLRGGEGTQLSVFFPLGFGGNKARARLEIFVEKQPVDKWGRGSPAIYFVFTVLTEEVGETQWSIYLRGRQLNLQVYAPDSAGKERLGDLVIQVEKSLKSRGYVLTTPTVHLKKAFKVPAGFRLNLKG